MYRAVKAGSQSPLLVTIPGKTFPNAWSVSALGALHELYVVSLHVHQKNIKQTFQIL